MAVFCHYAPKLQQFEGGFVNHKNDKGGNTMCGVTLATFQSFYGSRKKLADLLAMTQEQWCHIMKSGYWDKVLGDQIRNQSIAELVADWCVNAGVNGIKNMQKACGLKADGIVGPKTLAVLNSPNEEIIFNRIKEARILYYERIVLNDPSQRVFLNGWRNRTNKFVYIP